MANKHPKYAEAMELKEQGLSSKKAAARLGMAASTVWCWFTGYKSGKKAETVQKTVEKEKKAVLKVEEPPSVKKVEKTKVKETATPEPAKKKVHPKYAEAMILKEPVEAKNEEKAPDPKAVKKTNVAKPKTEDVVKTEDKAERKAHPKYAEAMKLFEQGVSGYKAAEMLGVPNSTVRTWFWRVRRSKEGYAGRKQKKVEEKPILRTTEDFMAALEQKRNVAIVNSDGTVSVKYLSYIEYDKEPRMMKAYQFVLKQCEDQLEFANHGKPVADNELRAACAKFITDYNLKHRLHTWEYTRHNIDDEEFL